MVDATLYERNLTLTGSVGFSSSGILGGCVQFNGTGYLSLPNIDLPDQTGEFSISFWIKTTSEGEAIGQWNYGGSWVVCPQAGGGFVSLFNNDGSSFNITSSTDLCDGSWHHLVLTCDGSTAKLYVDGSEEGNVSYTTDFTDRDLYIGNVDQAAGASWSGFIDELGIWDRVLISAEVLALYNSGSGIAFDISTLNSVVFVGSANSLILTNPGSLQFDNTGQATLSREYVCSKRHETSADAALSISSRPVNYNRPANVKGLSLTQVTKSEKNGILTYSVVYTGVNTAVLSETKGVVLESYSIKIAAGAPLFTGTYLAPTSTRYHVSSFGGYTPELPGTTPTIQIVSILYNGIPNDSLSSYTGKWSWASLNSTKCGEKYIIEATAIYLIHFT